MFLVKISHGMLKSFLALSESINIDRTERQDKACLLTVIIILD